MIFFTCDIDWAPEPVIEHTLGIFEAFDVPCTLFATHRSDVLDGCDRSRFEVAIHPNFNPLLNGEGGSIDRVLDAMLDMYPAARGFRSHSLTCSTPILDAAAERGLSYDSNQLVPYAADLEPFEIWNGLVRIPFNWEDDIHCMYGKGFAHCGIDRIDSGLHVFNFHPVHVYLNTESLERYRAAKPHYHDAEMLRELRCRTAPGTSDLLRDLLEFATSTTVETARLGDVAAAAMRQTRKVEDSVAAL